ncbi:PASTA domain-containing protein [Streptomyces sp. NPDC049555]|uniref:PASTA domain-containing protein n=1 Tax=Streptomyces sp. NPDC049555 TaxID=3154930 RepID=UPI00342E26D2
MPRHTTTMTALATAAALLTLTACDPDTTGSGGKPSAPRTAARTATLPNMNGKGLQSAQDQAQAAGFSDLTSHDALGRGRMQALDRNWKVCTQTPKPGEHPTNTKVDFGAVKLDETCPAMDEGTTPGATAGTTMPDFKGTSVKAARTALPGNTSLTVKDSTGNRMILVESNWQVCSQQPAPGTKLDGRPVSLTAVKFGESC